MKTTKEKNGAVRAQWTEEIKWDVTFQKKTWQYLQKLRKKKDATRIIIWCFLTDSELDPLMVMKILDAGIGKEDEEQATE